jgi:hypothetical protein
VREQSGNFALSNLARERSRSAIAGDLVVFHLLRGGDEREVGGDLFLALEFLDRFLAFRDESLHALAGFRLRLLPEKLECLAQALDVTFGLLKMLINEFLKFGMMRGFGHFR